MNTTRLLMTIAALLCCAGASPRASAEDIRFPDDAGAIDVTKPPFNAVGDGKTDCTDAIQRAFGAGSLVYVPNGTYVISDTIRWPGRQTRHVLQGQSRERTVILLADRAPGFTDVSKPKAMVWTGDFPPQRFRNAIRNLTFDVGGQNHGAIGVQYNASNQGQMNTVAIRSTRGAGLIGLDMGYTGDVGPLLVKDLVVDGFGIGIYTSHATACQTLENIALSGQQHYGWVNDGQALAVRNLRSNNRVPALWNKRGSGMVTLLGATLAGEGEAAADVGAIVNEGALYARDVKTSGYRVSIDGRLGSGKSEPATDVAEFTSQPPITLFDSPAAAIALPVEETPDVPWDDPKDWVSVATFKPREAYLDKAGKQLDGPPPKGTKATRVFDWTDAVQQAIDSGAPTVYFPRNNGTGEKYAMLGTVHVRKNVRRIIGMEGSILGHDAPTFELNDGTAPIVVIERFDWLYANMLLRSRTRRTLVARACIFNLDVGEGGTAFVEDAVCHVRVRKGARLWVRQWNTEYTAEPRHSSLWQDMPFYKADAKLDDMIKDHVGNLNDGGTFWALGLKTEGDGTLLTTINGGRSEVMGGLVYTNHKKNPDKRAFVVKDASLSVSVGEWVSRGQPFNMIEETRAGETRLLARGVPPARGQGAMIVLANAYAPRDGQVPAARPQPAAAAPADAPAASPPEKLAATGAGTGLTAEFFTSEFEELESSDVRLPVVEPNDPAVAGMNAYAVRFTGQMEPRKSGVHRFNTASPDCRLVVDGVVVVDAWRNGARYRDAGIALEAGRKYDVRFEARGGPKAPVRLTWAEPGERGDADVTPKLYPRAGTVPKVRLSASAARIVEGEGKVEVTLTRDGDLATPLTVRLAPPVDYSAAMAMRHAPRGTAVSGVDYDPLPDGVAFAPGEATATLTVAPRDDDHPRPDRSVVIELAPDASYDVAGAPVKLTLADDDLPPPGTGTGLAAAYFAGRGASEPLVERVDAALDFHWNETPPVKGIDMRNGFVARWEGQLQPLFTETYRLAINPSVYSAARVWVNGELVIDFANVGSTPGGRIGQAGSGSKSARLPLEAGRKYDVKVEYASMNHYGQQVSLTWSSPSQFEQVVPTTQLYPAATGAAAGGR